MLSNAKVTAFSLLLALFGILAFLALQALFEPQFLSISSLHAGLVESHVQVQGMITSSYHAKNALFFTVDDGARLRVLLFYPSTQALSIVKPGNSVRVSGKLQRLNTTALSLVASSVEAVEVTR